MMKNKTLIVFTLGLAIPTLIYPLVEELSDIAVSALEIVKGSQIKRITEINIENTKLAKELEDNQEECECFTNAIGFEVPSITDDEDDEEYYGDDE